MPPAEYVWQKPFHQGPTSDEIDCFDILIDGGRGRMLKRSFPCSKTV